MKIRKNIVLLSATIITLISLIALATYSYFTASVNTNNKITTSTKLPLRPTFAVSGGGELALTVTRNLTLEENKWDGNSSSWVSGKNVMSISKNLIVTLTGEPGTTCTYNVYYKDIGDNVYNPPHSGGSNEFKFYIYKNDVDLFNVEYYFISSRTINTSKTTALFGGSSSPFNQAKPTITIPSGKSSSTDTWTVQLIFYNRDWDQSYLAGKTFKGEVYIEDVSCT